MQSEPDRSVCAVALLSGEEQFVEEWIAYHRLIGVDHFVLYDNDPELPLRALLERFEPFVTVIDWPGDPTATWPGPNLQLKTYAHALELARSRFEWITFLDVDEFIVLRRHERLTDLLSTLGDCGSVRLNWHVFGHNGYYEDPTGLVTSSLTRRMTAPSPMTKAVTRTEAVATIPSAHFCRLKPGWRMVDANGRLYTDALYPGKTELAHVNHYQCRSFLSWMGRVQRGDVSYDPSNVPPEQAWRLDPHLCLRQFVETVAKNKNELVDEFMLRFETPIRAFLGSNQGPARAHTGPRLSTDQIDAAISGSRLRRGRGRLRRAQLAATPRALSRGRERVTAWRLQRRVLREPPAPR